ncbi:hypothetical protein [Nitrincola sp. A-D6]|uniref:hypothetical protein n=1 Tax=Nitrincola sp. A-D6 TaxID=1545442 RepID=UPI00068AFFFE|nr:hypothetical protein [Nitrincola sp. A-D6]
MPLNVKDGSVWKEIKNVFVKINGIWSEVNEVFIKDNGAWKLSHKSGFTLTLSSDTNINLYSLFAAEYGEPSGAVSITVIVPVGVIIGGAGATALTVGNFSLGSTITLVNQGSIQGFGGSINGGTGGDAINTSVPISIDNQGTIYGGGGGGGKGGDGGQGSASTSTSSWVRLNSSTTGVNISSSSYSVQARFDSGTFRWRNNRSTRVRIYHASCVLRDTRTGQVQGTTSNAGAKTINAGATWNSGISNYGMQPLGMTYSWLEHEVTSTNTTTYDGGIGGNGGQGTGFSQSGTNGTQGTQGGTNSGSGGNGGNGGDWGASGNVGANGTNGNHTNGTSGQVGGLAGHYIVGNANVTWINQGTVAGRAA